MSQDSLIAAGKVIDETFFVKDEWTPRGHDCEIAPARTRNVVYRLITGNAPP
jgi:hypothetical protein